MKIRSEKGYTLLEIVISMLLTAVMVSAVMSLAITSQQTGNKIDRSTIANQCSRHLSETLAQYVSADNDGTGTNTIIPGPTHATADAASWSLTSITGEDGRAVTDACPGGGSACWALMTGVHTPTGFLPAWFEGAPYNATIFYNVSGGGVNPTQVSVSVTWTEP